MNMRQVVPTPGPAAILTLAIFIPTGLSRLDDHDHHEYCQNVLPQSNIPGTNLDTLAVVGGCLYFFMALATLLFIRYAAILAARVREQEDIDVKSPVTDTEMKHSVSSVIFPVFVGVLWAQFAISLFTGLIIAFVPVEPGEHNNMVVSFLYAST